MKTYTHRQRVMAAFNHKEPDRVPIDLMGHASMLLDKTYLRLRDYLGLSPIPPVRSGTTANYYDERILQYLDIDFRRIFLKKKHENMKIQNDGSYIDEWGIQYQKHGLYYNVVDHPMKNFTSIEEIENYNWPEAQDMFTIEGLKELSKEMFENTEYALVARNPMTAGFLDRACLLMGMPEFLITMATDPGLAQCIINKMLKIYMDVYTMFLDECGSYVQMVETGDDLGTQESTIISPGMYREFIKPADRELYALIHKKAPEAKLFRHCDGAIFELIPDFIEIGIDVLNPVQTSSKGMDAYKLKEAYGNAIIFHGTLENVASSIDVAVSEVKERMKIFAPEGGFVISTCNHLIDIEPENIIKVFETIKESGLYNTGNKFNTFRRRKE